MTVVIPTSGYHLVPLQVSSTIEVITWSGHLDSLRQSNPNYWLSLRRAGSRTQTWKPLELAGSWRVITSHGHSQGDWCPGYNRAHEGCQRTPRLTLKKPMPLSSATSLKPDSRISWEKRFCSKLWCNHSSHLNCTLVFKALSFAVFQSSMGAMWV